MPNRVMSQYTVDLMVLLRDDGVHGEELKALVSSAFQDGVNYTIERLADSDDLPDV